MKTIKYSKNWNKKLDNEFYTTIRRASDYWKPGEIYEVWVQGTAAPDHRALLCGKRSAPLSKLPDFTLCTDTGLMPDQARDLFKKMYKNVPPDDLVFDILLFHNPEV